MLEAERAALREYAERLRAKIVWSKYPKLAEIFEHRPPQNVMWIELARLIKELRSS
jgi:hypothetical protein